MNNREKVIKGLECCTFILGKRKCNECPYQKDNGCYQLQDDFHVLLKEQKAVEPKFVDVNTWMCSECGALLGWEEFSQFGLELIKYKYCPECGHEVKWE